MKEDVHKLMVCFGLCHLFIDGKEFFTMHAMERVWYLGVGFIGDD